MKREANPFARMLMNRDKERYAQMLVSGEIPEDMTAKELAEGITAIMMPKLDSIIELEWQAKEREGRLLELVAE